MLAILIASAITLQAQRLDPVQWTLAAETAKAPAGSTVPPRMDARVSRTQRGHNESVVLGHPSPGEERFQLFASGAGAQDA